MKLNVTLGCSCCSFFEEKDVQLPFNCEDMVCPRCRENSLSIVLVKDSGKISEMEYPKDPLLEELYKIRRL